MNDPDYECYCDYCEGGENICDCPSEDDYDEAFVCESFPKIWAKIYEENAHMHDDSRFSAMVIDRLAVKEWIRLNKEGE